MCVGCALILSVAHSAPEETPQVESGITQRLDDDIDRRVSFECCRVLYSPRAQLAANIRHHPRSWGKALPGGVTRWQGTVVLGGCGNIA